METTLEPEVMPTRSRGRPRNTRTGLAETVDDGKLLAISMTPEEHDRLYDAFGPARWFWGTDITRMPCPWRQCVTLFTEELPWLRGWDLELVMGRALCDWIGWKR